MLILGIITLLLMPKREHDHRPLASRTRRSLAATYPLIAGSTAFWLIAIGMFACNIPQALHSQQMKLLLLENGAASATASMMISLYATGVIVGRFGSGLALDRLPTHWVAAICMGVPSIGLAIIASSFDTTPVLAFAMLLMGFSQGAEGDVLAYVVTRYFDLDIYSSVLGVLSALMSGATACGAVLLSYLLQAQDSFTTFVVIGAVMTSLGALLLLALGKVQAMDSTTPTVDRRAAAQGV